MSQHPVAVIPTVFPRFVQFVTRMLGLAAVPTMMFDRFVEVMIGPFCPVLAFGFVGTEDQGKPLGGIAVGQAEELRHGTQ